ncbi:helix-turn-helix domain-containing protein [Streptomyces sp. ATCC 21386]|uniref:helix-turn-helix domain-containing protein n=1 Tax=Streptomyces sp. ATCC 21386 TaxID=2699428 RepID=UPI001BFF0ECF|nr:helix-turn-helix domain-containing protein [Streptomyces sp. ATCC 21386]
MENLKGTVEALTDWLVKNQWVVVEDILTAVWRDGIPDSPLSRDPALVTVVRSETKMLFARTVRGIRDSLQEPVRSPEARHIARIAALHETPLNDLVASYRIAHGVVQDAFFQAAHEADLPEADVLPGLQHCCSRLSHLMALVTELVTDEYTEAVRASTMDENTLRLQAVRTVLNHADSAAELPFYDLNAEHVAVVASGAAARTLAEFARERGDSALSVFVDRGVVWAWFSSVGPEQVHEAVLERTPHIRLGTGGPGKGVRGFRQAHREARSAYHVCDQTERRSAHFYEVAPEVIGMADVDAARSLVHRHLGQLVGGGSRHSVLRKTLETYLASGQSARSAALKLGLTERTVANRLQAARALLPPHTELSSLELALSLRLRSLVTGQSSDT